MQRRQRAAAVAAVMVALLASLPLLIGSADAQQQVQLPEEVSTWMERDQVQRWAGLLQAGQELFAEGSCVRCHGEGGSGGSWAPDLTDADWVQGDGSLGNIGEVIVWGVRRQDFADSSRRFQMNPSGGMQLEFDQVRAITAYVWSLSNGTQLPQR